MSRERMGRMSPSVDGEPMTRPMYAVPSLAARDHAERLMR